LCTRICIIHLEKSASHPKPIKRKDYMLISGSPIPKYSLLCPEVDSEAASSRRRDVWPEDDDGPPA